MNTPLIVTVLLNDEAQVFFDEQRSKYFPAAINFIQAHLTLFHHLPDNDTSVLATLQTLCVQQKAISLPITAVVNTGKGVAYKIESQPLVLLHKKLQKHWHPLLTAQDRQGLWPHITVQNKVSAQAAYETEQALRASFRPFTAVATGLTLWRYLNGPWQLYRHLPFAG